MPDQGQTALIVPVPFADPLLAAVARRRPDAVRPGVAAHVSLLYPFLPASDIDAPTLRLLRSFTAGQPPVALSLDKVERSRGFVALPAPALAPPAKAVRERWPQLVPYRGRYGTSPDPHLTVALLDRATDDTDDEAESGHLAECARTFLPLSGTVDRLWLVEFDGAWRVAETFPFTG